MAAVTFTAAQVAPVEPSRCEILPLVAGAVVLTGQTIAWTAAGLAVLADADGAGTLKQGRGIALNDAGIGQAVDCFKRGCLAGYNLAALSVGDPVFLGATPGTLDTVITGTVAAVAQVMPSSDSNTTPTKLLWVDFSWSVPYV